jgi:hypothetical protein
VAGGPGFEPRLTESESAVLPLNYPPPAPRKKPRKERLWHAEKWSSCWCLDCQRLPPPSCPSAPHALYDAVAAVPFSGLAGSHR